MSRIAALLAAVVLTAPLAARTALDDLEAAKARFASADYQGSLTLLDMIERNLRDLQADEARARIAPALAFYRAADYAMLGARDDAVTGFAEFLRLAPGSSIDPGAYPAPVLAAFAEARKRSRGRAARESGIEAAYTEFSGGSTADETDARGDFANGPLAELMTPAERADWSSAVSARERAAVIEEFWRRRNPSPDSARNPMRGELDKRIAFSDMRFRDGETRGALTDRGRVFVLLGPPYSIGVKPLSGSEDPSVGQKASEIAPLPLGATPAMVAEHNREVDTNPTLSYGAQRNMREIWHYRTLPPGIPARAADFDFVTRQGGGTAQLARTPQAVQILEAVRRTLRPA